MKCMNILRIIKNKLLYRYNLNNLYYLINNDKVIRIIKYIYLIIYYTYIIGVFYFHKK